MTVFALPLSNITCIIFRRLRYTNKPEGGIQSPGTVQHDRHSARPMRSELTSVISMFFFNKINSPCMVCQDSSDDVTITTNETSVDTRGNDHEIEKFVEYCDENKTEFNIKGPGGLL